MLLERLRNDKFLSFSSCNSGILFWRLKLPDQVIRTAILAPHLFYTCMFTKLYCRQVVNTYGPSFSQECKKGIPNRLLYHNLDSWLLLGLLHSWRIANTVGVCMGVQNLNSLINMHSWPLISLNASVLLFWRYLCILVAPKSPACLHYVLMTDYSFLYIGSSTMKSIYSAK